MLKPLLRTLPTLSGNVKLACTLKDYEKLSNGEYSCFVRYARLLPLSSNLSQKNIETNLLFSSYDYDLARFFKHYSNYFYDYVYEYDKKNYIELDKTLAQKNRNTDFEFGCKRVSYKKNDAQYAFYAPLYIDTFDDIPDYFNIHIILKNNKYEIERNIKVNISSKLTKNYLYMYLKNYLTKIDSNVIFCNSKSNQATYYGIDLVSGGTKKIVDNIIAKSFTKQNTINNFDAIITNGFKRNLIVIRQILPFCWYFNINDILNEDEKDMFKNSEVYINGYWYKDNERLPFYDIDSNYQYHYQNPYLINRNNGIFSYINSVTNIMNIGYPSLNDCMYIGYRYSNKLEKKYNRWKLKYSEDSHPYIINLSPAFSINQGSFYKYGQFPEKYSSINLITKDKNIILPIGNALKNEDSPYFKDNTLVSNYYKILNNNISSWYVLKNGVDFSKVWEEDIWENTQDNKVYYNGILYDFNKIYEEYPEIFDTIDKFSVIVNSNFKPVSKLELNKIKRGNITIFNSDKYIKNKNTFINNQVSYLMSTGEFSKLTNFYNINSNFGTGDSEVDYNNLFIEDENGDFIDIVKTGYDIDSANKYYKYADIVDTFSNNYIFRDEIYDILKNYQESSFWINGYQLIDANYLNNLLHENNRYIIFENKDNKWFLNNLYFSQQANSYKTLYDRDVVSNLISQFGDKKNVIPIYFKTKFISAYNIKEIFKESYKDNMNYYQIALNNLNNIPSYEYNTIIKDENKKQYSADCFTKKEKVNDNIYVDIYNLTNVINDYNSRFGTEINASFEDTESWYVKFLNMKHILFYISDLYKNDKAEADLLRLYDSLYIKQRIFISKPELLDFSEYDQYIHISKLYDMYRPLTTEEKINILDNGKINKTGIYYKTKNQYSKTTYKRVDSGNYVYEDGSMVLSLPDKEYHYTDFYINPERYLKIEKRVDDSEDSTVEVNYVPVIEYIKNYVSNYDSVLYRYITKEMVSELETKEVEDIDFDSTNFVGIRIGLKQVGFYKDNDKIREAFYDTLSTLKSYIRRLNNIKDSLYTKVNFDNEVVWVKVPNYSNYLGINDYIKIPDKIISKAIILGYDNIITYTINEFGEFVQTSYNDEYYTLRDERDSDYIEFIKEVVSSFPSDIEFYPDNNYYKFSKSYLYKNDIDSILQIPDYDTEFNSKFTFEVVFKKNGFVKLDDTLYELMNLTNDDKPYKDLYLYRLYKKDEYPSTLRINYYNQDPLNGQLYGLENCLFPLFDDIFLQDKKYTVIYSENTKSNVFKNGRYYNYNIYDIKYLYDISHNPYDMEYISSNGKYYTPKYFNELRNSGNLAALENHNPLKTYKILNNCYCLNSKVYDDLSIYDKYNINTYIYSTVSTYSYTYTESELSVQKSETGSYTMINNVERTGVGYLTSYTTYGFIYINSYFDNTEASFNIVDNKYKEVKYFTYINEHNIYDSKFNILDSFNLMLPASKMNILENLFTYNYDTITIPKKYSIDTFYKQVPINNDFGYTYAYSINLRNNQIDTVILQRYFDNIVPFIKETNMLESTYCLKYKNYKYPNTDINYVNDIFYSENINIYNYNKIRVYDSDNSYTLYEPIEYKHLNDNKLINLKEEFEIKEFGTFVYSEILKKEKHDYVLDKFKKYVLIDKLNTFDDNEILFLFNRYDIEYDVECVGLNWTKTDKIYTLTYKFKLL